MYSPEELKSLHQFLKSTGEGNLKNMLCGGKMTEVHLRVLLKVARNSKEEEFIQHWENSSFPKVKFAPNESALKESCYPVFAEACGKVGLLSAAKKAA